MTHSISAKVAIHALVISARSGWKSPWGHRTAEYVKETLFAAAEILLAGSPFHA